MHYKQPMKLSQIDQFHWLLFMSVIEEWTNVRNG